MKKDDDLKQIKRLLEIVKHKVDLMEVSRKGQSATMYLMKDQQSAMNGKLDVLSKDIEGVKETQDNMKETQEDHTSRLEALSGDTEELLNKVKGIKDGIGLWHQRDKREIDEIKRHLDMPIMSDIP